MKNIKSIYDFHKKSTVKPYFDITEKAKTDAMDAMEKALALPTALTNNRRYKTFCVSRRHQ
jgi:hypothetical protein